MTMDNFTATEIDIILKKHRILFLFRVIAIVCAALALLVAIAFFLLFRFGKSDISQLKICLFIAVPFAVLLFVMAYLSGWEKNYWVFKVEKKRKTLRRKASRKRKEADSRQKSDSFRWRKPI